MTGETDPAGARAMASGGALLLDVREDHEWAAGHAPEARHMPLSRLDPSLLPAGVPVAAVCRSGGRSGVAAQHLAAAGITVTNVAGGMLAWSAAGLPVVDDTGAPGTVVAP